MTTILQYDSYEAMWQSMGEKASNEVLAVRRVIGDRYNKIETDYKESSGFNERYLKTQQEEKKKNPHRSNFPPSLVALPDDEHIKMLEQNKDFASDLVLKAVFGLYAVGNKYTYDAGSHAQGLGVEYSNVQGTMSIEALVQDVKKTLSILEQHFFGAKMTPVFYTINEENSLVPEDIRNDPNTFLAGLKAEMADDSFPLSDEQKKELMDGFTSFATSNETMRGFSEQECTEFIRLYKSAK